MNQFAVDTSQVTSEVAPPKYDHGFSSEEELKIKEAKKAIDNRDLSDFPVTLEEFQTVIVPWNRIHRVEQFILHPPKAKKASTRKPRASAGTRTSTPRVAKPKKLTKKAIAEKINDIVFKQATGAEVTEEEKKFLEEQTSGGGLL